MSDAVPSARAVGSSHQLRFPYLVIKQQRHCHFEFAVEDSRLLIQVIKLEGFFQQRSRQNAIQYFWV